MTFGDNTSAKQLLEELIIVKTLCQNNFDRVNQELQELKQLLRRSSRKSRIDLSQDGQIARSPSGSFVAAISNPSFEYPPLATYDVPSGHHNDATNSGSGRAPSESPQSPSHRPSTGRLKRTSNAGDSQTIDDVPASRTTSTSSLSWMDYGPKTKGPPPTHTLALMLDSTTHSKTKAASLGRRSIGLPLAQTPRREAHLTEERGGASTRGQELEPANPSRAFSATILHSGPKKSLADVVLAASRQKHLFQRQSQDLGSLRHAMTDPMMTSMELDLSALNHRPGRRGSTSDLDFRAETQPVRTGNRASHTNVPPSPSSHTRRPPTHPWLTDDPPTTTAAIPPHPASATAGTARAHKPTFVEAVHRVQHLIRRQRDLEAMRETSAANAAGQALALAEPLHSHAGSQPHDAADIVVSVRSSRSELKEDLCLANHGPFAPIAESVCEESQTSDAGKATSIIQYESSTSKPTAPAKTPPTAKQHSLPHVAKVLKAFFWDVVSPSDGTRARWDVLMLLLLLYVCVCIPYIVCFDVNVTNFDEPMAVIDMVANLLFATDMYVNFRTSYIGVDGKYVVQRHLIAYNYARSWLLVDFMSTVPWDFVLLAINGNGRAEYLKAVRMIRLLKIFKMVKLLSMVRLLKFAELIRAMEDYFGRATLKILTLISSALMLIHWNACGFYLTSALADNDERTTWVGTHHLRDESKLVRYVTSLYWSVTTMSTVGYGDYTPISILEKIYTMVAMLMGVTIFAYFMGAMASMLSALHSVHARMTRKRQAVDDFLHNRKIPSLIGERVRDFYEYVIEREMEADESEIIAGLSSSLRNEVVLYLYKETLEKVPFFRNKNPQFIANIVTCLKLEHYAAGDIIVKQGEAGGEMYFIAQGKLEVRVYDVAALATMRVAVDDLQQKDKENVQPPIWAFWRKNWLSSAQNSSNTYGTVERANSQPYRVLDRLKEGQYFGEYACLLGTTRTATVIAADFSELYCLKRTDLEAVVQKWPELAAEFDSMVQGFKGVPDNSSDGLSDDGSLSRERSQVITDPRHDDPYQRFKHETEMRVRLQEAHADTASDSGRESVESLPSFMRREPAEPRLSTDDGGAGQPSLRNRRFSRSKLSFRDGDPAPALQRKLNKSKVHSGKPGQPPSS